MNSSWDSCGKKMCALAVTALLAVLGVFIGQADCQTRYTNMGACMSSGVANLCQNCSVHHNGQACTATECDAGNSTLTFCMWWASATGAACLTSGSGQVTCTDCRTWACETNGSNSMCFVLVPGGPYSCECTDGGGDFHAGDHMVGNYTTCTQIGIP
jgi:hypothetical protein